MCLLMSRVANFCLGDSLRFGDGVEREGNVWGGGGAQQGVDAMKSTFGSWHFRTFQEPLL